jgi:mevalonate pyrophosphate decarboxylase
LDIELHVSDWGGCAITTCLQLLVQKMSPEPESKSWPTITVCAPANIALVKYWGKRDEETMLPLNDSISVSIDELKATTTVQIHESCAEDDVVIINGKVHAIFNEFI